MKLAVASILLAVFLIGAAHAAPQSFDFAGMKGTMDTTSIVNGEKGDETSQDMSRAAEEFLKSMIHKHLANKKSAKKAARKEKVKKVPAPVAQAAIPAQLNNINWDDHPESKALLNEKITGGTETVDALIKLLQEQKAKQAKQ